MTGRPYDVLTAQLETLVTVNNSTRPDENIPPTAEPRYNEPLYVESLYNEPRYNEVPRYNERFLHPSHRKKYMKKNLDITKPRYNEQIDLQVPWPFVISRFQTVHNKKIISSRKS